MDMNAFLRLKSFQNYPEINYILTHFVEGAQKHPSLETCSNIAFESFEGDSPMVSDGSITSRDCHLP